MPPVFCFCITKPTNASSQIHSHYPVSRNFNTANSYMHYIKIIEFHLDDDEPSQKPCGSGRDERILIFICQKSLRETCPKLIF